VSNFYHYAVKYFSHELYGQPEFFATVVYSNLIAPLSPSSCFLRSKRWHIYCIKYPNYSNLFDIF